jgi:hypothetical protein
LFSDVERQQAFDSIDSIIPAYTSGLGTNLKKVIQCLQLEMPRYTGIGRKPYQCSLSKPNVMLSLQEKKEWTSLRIGSERSFWNPVEVIKVIVWIQEA